MAAFTGVEAVFCWVGYLAGCGWRGLAGWVWLAGSGGGWRGLAI